MMKTSNEMTKRDIVHNYIDNIETFQFCGKEYGLSNVFTLSFPYKVFPTGGEHDYRICEGCQSRLAQTTDILTKRYWGNLSKEAFPNCCKYHINLLKNPHFIKEFYNDVPKLTAEKILFTQQHIINHILKDDWEIEILDYINYCIESFGSMPKDCGAPLFIEEYETGIKGFLGENKHFPKEKIDLILNAIRPHDISNTDNLKNRNFDFRLLIGIYEKWLKIFPFQIHNYFKNLKIHFENTLPILTGKETINKYSGTIKAEMHTPKTLVELLALKTKELILKVNPIELLEQGLISDLKKHRLELANEKLRISTEKITKDFSKGELRYINTIKKWLEIQSDYFKEIEPIFENKKHEPIDDIEDILKGELKKYQFFELPKIKKLNQDSKDKLYLTIKKESLPYKVAMLNFLGFFNHLLTNHFTSQFKVNKEVSKLFNSDAQGRTIRGLINSLNPQSNEDKKRYTAYLHKEKVEKDYQNLK